jgi:hypothetical protein
LGVGRLGVGGLGVEGIGIGGLGGGVEWVSSRNSGLSRAMALHQGNIIIEWEGTLSLIRILA